jgi:hypothetical protein
MFRAEQLYEDQKEEDRILNLDEKDDDDDDVVEERIEKDESLPGKTPTSQSPSTQMKRK